MSEREHERRRESYPVKVHPRPSPASLLIVAVIAVLGAAAAATAFLGPVHDDATPHGQVLGDLQRVADAQAAHFVEHGSFAGWIQTLDIRSHPTVRLTIVRADEHGWEVVAVHEIGLTCARSGSVDARGRPAQEPPVCYAQPEQ